MSSTVHRHPAQPWCTGRGNHLYVQGGNSWTPAASGCGCGRRLAGLCLALLRHPVQEEQVCLQRRAVHLRRHERVNFGRQGDVRVL